ncbi:MAG: molybdopterin cofactor-binding domain-containing protein, partial [Nostoc sp.]
TASVKVKIFASGEVKVQSGTQDIGTGTYTVMTQVAAEVLGLPVQFELGDSNLPKAPMTGNSITVASVSPAVHQAAIAARDKIIKMAIVDGNSL